MSVVAVLGGGISGLTTAYYLNKLQTGTIRKIILVEKSSKLGGWIKTSRYEDGTLHEQGPRSIRPAGDGGVTTLNLVEDLGLSSRVLPVPLGHPSTKTRFILVNNKLYPLPTGFKALFRAVPPFNKPLILAIANEYLTSKTEKDDDSMYNFAYRRLGRDIADFAIDPLCRGVVAGDAKEISVKTILKPFFDAEQKHGSIVKGMIKTYRDTRQKAKLQSTVQSNLVKKAKSEQWRMWNLEGGLQTLPEAMEKSLRAAGVEINLNSNFKLQFSGDKALLKTPTGVITADHVFSSLPAHNMKEVIRDHHPQLATMLDKIPQVTVGLVNLEFNGNCLNREGFGFLVPSNQKSDILGIVFDSCNFPEHNGENADKTRLTVMMGGRWFEPIFGNPNRADSEFLLWTAINAVSKHLDIKQPPSRQEVFILKDCIPQYIVGHGKRVQDIRKHICDNKLPLTLIGASYDGVSVNDCIHHSRKSVEKFLGLLR